MQRNALKFTKKRLRSSPQLRTKQMVVQLRLNVAPMLVSEEMSSTGGRQTRFKQTYFGQLLLVVGVHPVVGDPIHGTEL